MGRHGDMETWRHGDMGRHGETWGDMETWRHGDMETWGDMGRHGETWRHGDMETSKLYQDCIRTHDTTLIRHKKVGTEEFVHGCLLVYTCVAVMGRNRTLFSCVFRPCYHIQSKLLLRAGLIHAT